MSTLPVDAPPRPLRVDEREPSPEEREVFLAAVREGTNPAQAASLLPCDWHPLGHRTASMFNRYGNRDAEFAGLYAEALRERERVMEFRVEKLVEDRAFEEGSSPQLVIALASAWSPRHRRDAGRAGDADASVSFSWPMIDVGLLTDAQAEELYALGRRAEELIAIGQGRAANPERAQLESGEAA